MRGELSRFDEIRGKVGRRLNQNKVLDSWPLQMIWGWGLLYCPVRIAGDGEKVRPYKC